MNRCLARSSGFYTLNRRLGGPNRIKCHLPRGHNLQSLAASRPSLRGLCQRRSNVRCAAESAEGDRGSDYQLAPVVPRTPFGELLTYYLKMEPRLFKSAVEDQLNVLKEQKEAQRARQEAEESIAKDGNADGSDVVLYKRMDEVRHKEAIATLEDLMYISVIEKFVELGISMMPRMEGFMDTPGDLSQLTEGIHSKQALEVVKSHVLNILGPASMAFNQAKIKIGKLQMAQVYATSVMFGYFLRRVDKRFQLAKQLGMLPSDKDNSAQSLEQLFNEASSMVDAEDPDSTSPSSSDSESDGSTTSKSGKPPLVEYVEQFDQETLMEMSHIVSREGSELIERQIYALFGDINELQAQMQAAIPESVFSVEDLNKYVEQAVENEKVDTLTFTVGTHRRAVLEAVAFGTFLRDVETWVENDYGILTALPIPDIPPDLQGPPLGPTM